MTQAQATRSNGKQEEPPNEEVPLINQQLESAILATILEQPELLAGIPLQPEHFGGQANQHIARAISFVAAEGTVNLPNVAIALKTMGRLEQVGGTKSLVQLVETTPAATLEDVQSWYSQVRGLWEKRFLLNQARALVAKLATGSVENHFDAFRQTYEVVEGVKPHEAVPLGVWAADLADPCERPEPETWLLTDDITGKPALPIGRAAMLSASGGTGKTTVLVQLTVSVALGYPWCGFRIDTPGRVVLCCGESDKRLVLRHLWRAYNALGLDENDRRLAAQRIRVYPLAGKEVNMIRGTSNNDIERTEFLAAFAEELRSAAIEGKFQWSLIVLDPLSRFAGPDTESNNAAATRFTQAVETLTTLPGTPAIICAHHSSKNSITNGRNDARGVSGLRDGFRALFTLTRCKAETVVGVHMTCDKSNEAPHFQDRWLVQGTGDEGGTLRLATDPEAALLEETAHPPRRGRQAQHSPEPKPEDGKPPARETILQILETMQGVAKSRRWLETHKITGYRSGVIREAFRELEQNGMITIDESGPTRGTVRMVGMVRQTELPLNSEPSVSHE